MNDHAPQNPFLEEEINLHEYMDVLVRRRWIVFSFTIILCTLALIRAFMMKPVYQGATRLLIEKEAQKVVRMDEVTPVDFSAREYYQTQYKILKSRAVAEKVDQALKGYQPWDDWSGRKTGKNVKPLTDQKRVNLLLNRVQIKPIPNTQLVEILVDDVDKEMAAKIANLWSDNYVAYILDAKFDANQYASTWLNAKIKEAQQNLEEAVGKLQGYKKANNIVAEDSSEKSMSAGDALQDLLKRKSDLEIEIAEKLEHFKEKHPEILGLRSELANINEKISGEKDKEMLSGGKGVQYSVFKRDVETNRQIYDSLLQRMRETQVTGELKTTNIRVVDKAFVPEKPVRPKKRTDLLVALMIGIFGGGLLAFFFEGLDQSIKTPEDLKNRVKLPCLAAIAMPNDDDDKSVKPEFITHLKPRSTISEAYRGLRTSIMFTAVERKRKIIMLTSSGPQEGKTTSAINLAIAMAQSGEKTILLDADLRKPRVEEAFGLKSDHGLTDILAGTEKLASDVHKTEIPNLDIITCGSIPPNPSELLGSKKMEEFLAELEKRYDRIIIDTPPVLAVTDAVVLSGKVDGVVLVVRAGETHKNAITRAKELLESARASNIIGAVLNMVEHGKTSGYYYYYRQYYGKKYGKYYGEKSKEKSKS